MTGANTSHVDAVRRAVDALNRGDVDTYGAAFHPSCMRWSSGSDEAVPAAAVLDTLRELHRCFAGFRLHADLLIGDGKYVVARWRTTGKHVEEFASLPATQREVSIPTCEVYELDDEGRIVATWNYGDPNELVRQLTAEPARSHE
ncbi:MAG TPA: ester cyclase [Acidimicrobiales bacterium]